VGKRSRSDDDGKYIENRAGNNEWPTAGTLHILDEHLRELAECKNFIKIYHKKIRLVKRFDYFPSERDLQE
jgi:hypothetical protein